MPQIEEDRWYQERISALLACVTVIWSLPPERSEDRVTVDNAAATRPGEVWARAGDAFERWAGGDAVALDELVAVMTPVLWQVVRAHRLPPEVAEDVVQTTWLTLVRRRDAIVDPLAVGGWLTTTARRESWRVAKANGRSLATEDEELSRALPDDESAESAVVRRDGDRRLWAAVDRLAERCRRLLRIVAFEHRPDYARISADLEMPVGSIGPTRARCLDKLRALLADELADEQARQQASEPRTGEPRTGDRRTHDRRTEHEEGTDA